MSPDPPATPALAGGRETIAAVLPRAAVPARRVLSAVATASAVVLALNGLFLALMYLSAGADALVRQRVRAAFAAGELGTVDFPPADAWRGIAQYTDCVVLQMLGNVHASRTEQALAPRMYYPDNERWDGQCLLLRALMVDGAEPPSLQLLSYSRYWHGYNVVAGAGLRVMELGTLRRTQTAAVWGAIALLAWLAWRSHGIRTRRTGLLVALACASVWAVPNYAPSLVDGPGGLALLLALAVPVAWPRLASRLETLLVYAAGAGAIAAFFDMLTGLLPTGVAWVALVTLAAGRDEERPGSLAPMAAVPAAVLAFTIAAAVTVAAKQAAVVVLTDMQPGGDFAAQLALYMTPPESRFGLPGMVLPFIRLARSASRLVFDSVPAGYLLVAATAATWLAAVRAGWRRRLLPDGRDRLLVAAVALVPFAWTALLPNHTYLHASIMVRMLVVTVSASAIAAVCPRAAGG